MIPFNLEPIIINTNLIGEWVHPNIETVIQDLDYDDMSETYTASDKTGLMVMNVIFDNKSDDFKSVHIVFTMSKNSYEFMLRSYKNEDLNRYTLDNILETVIFKLLDYSWKPLGTNTEFTSTDFGNSFIEAYSLEDTTLQYSSTFELCIHDYDGWDYST